jgi:hypothetical protein
MPRFDLLPEFKDIYCPKSQRTLWLEHRDDERRFAELHPEPGERKPAAVAAILAIMAVFGVR